MYLKHYQSSSDETIGTRIFLYGYHAGKNLNPRIIKFSLSHVLYTVLSKEKTGKDYIILDVPSCSIGNQNYTDCKIRIDINFTNLLSFSLNDFRENHMEAFSFFYLYKYLKDKKNALQKKI